MDKFLFSHALMILVRFSSLLSQFNARQEAGVVLLKYIPSIFIVNVHLMFSVIATFAVVNVDKIEYLEKKLTNSSSLLLPHWKDGVTHCSLWHIPA